MLGRAKTTPPPPTLQGERVTLRPYRLGFSREEIAQLHRWDQDEEVLSWSGGPLTTLSLEEYAHWLQKQSSDTNSSRSNFFILDETGKLIGRIGYYHLDTRRAKAKLGIVLGEKNYWGKGYGRDALATFLKFLFGDLGLKRVHLATFPNNLRAQRCFASCGFHRSGTDREFFLDWGWRDEILMSITREDFLDQLEREAMPPQNTEKRREHERDVS